MIKRAEDMMTVQKTFGIGSRVWMRCGDATAPDRGTIFGTVVALAATTGDAMLAGSTTLYKVQAGDIAVLWDDQFKSWYDPMYLCHV